MLAPPHEMQAKPDLCLEGAAATAADAPWLEPERRHPLLLEVLGLLLEKLLVAQKVNVVARSENEIGVIAIPDDGILRRTDGTTYESCGFGVSEKNARQALKAFVRMAKPRIIVFGEVVSAEAVA